MKIQETPQIIRLFEGKFASLVLFSTDGLKELLIFSDARMCTLICQGLFLIHKTVC